MELKERKGKGTRGRVCSATTQPGVLYPRDHKEKVKGLLVFFFLSRSSLKHSLFDPVCLLSP